MKRKLYYLKDGKKIPGEYQGSVSKSNIYPPHEQIYIKPFTTTIVSIDNYYSIEFEKNNTIQLPILNLEVIDSRQQYIYFDIMDTPCVLHNDFIIGRPKFGTWNYEFVLECAVLLGTLWCRAGLRSDFLSIYTDLYLRAKNLRKLLKPA